MAGFLAEVTPVVITVDEEVNIGRTLGQLGWAREVIVVDSESTDRTGEIAASFPNVRFVTRAFDDLASQWTFASSLATTAWVLTLDADYFVPAAFVKELDAVMPPPDVAAYEARFVYAVGGRPVRGSLYTPRPVVLRRAAAGFTMDGHTQRARVDGRTEQLRERLVHDDRKSLRRFIERQRRYMRDEAAKLHTARWRSLNTAGRLRRLIVVAPFAVVVHTLFARRAILDGRAGLRYALERFLAESILSWELLRR